MGKEIEKKSIFKYGLTWIIFLLLLTLLFYILSETIFNRESFVTIYLLFIMIPLPILTLVFSVLSIYQGRRMLQDNERKLLAISSIAIPIIIFLIMVIILLYMFI